MDWPTAVVALDGGGMRGIYQARALQKLAILFPTLLDKISVFSGTSTGAIVASALAIGTKPEKLVGLYDDLGTEIFRRRVKRLQYYARTVCTRPAYSARRLHDCLHSWFEDKPLGECKPRVLAAAISLATQQLTLFDSCSPKHRNIPIVDVLMSCTAAPTYFPPHFVKEMEGYFVDAGLGCNNPSLETTGILLLEGTSRANLGILSIGTCSPRRTNLRRSSTSSSLFSWGRRALDIAMRVSSRSADQWCSVFFGGTPNYVRVDSELEKDIPLDSCDPSEHQTLRGLAVAEVNDRMADIAAWRGSITT